MTINIVTNTNLCVLKTTPLTSEFSKHLNQEDGKAIEINIDRNLYYYVYIINDLQKCEFNIFIK
jgi:hypothetical protein